MLPRASQEASRAPFGWNLGVFWKISETLVDGLREMLELEEGICCDSLKYAKTLKNTVRYCKNRGSEGHNFDEKSSWKASWHTF